ncbi:hypothetical protein GOP47_0008734 [Adiantum capillus-veneris]|uniref:Uncharacterized protein n=1 Tax=Adiantum capillus-veneris TaxID=13818 RepID=A0A9D4UZV3_ADICA|nr:hypothetical protein GOP47_0008733 [Adiantum capillus-veneris]KAI5076669.1 hypothetical protein GOP47_0008734 [Adiantum capillus-veneris]
MESNAEIEEDDVGTEGEGGREVQVMKMQEPQDSIRSSSSSQQLVRGGGGYGYRMVPFYVARKFSSRMVLDEPQKLEGPHHHHEICSSRPAVAAAADGSANPSPRPELRRDRRKPHSLIKAFLQSLCLAPRKHHKDITSSEPFHDQ